MVRKLRKNKNEIYPKIPKTPKQVRKILNKPYIQKEFCRTLDEEEAFYVDTIIESKYSFSVFASHKIISFIKAYIEPCERNYLMDGTFKIVPRQYTQLFIISIEFKNKVSFLSMKKINFLFLYSNIEPLNLILSDISSFLHPHD